MIPLGISTSTFSSTKLSQYDACLKLGIQSSKSFVLLWTGRFEQHCKSHQASTFRVLENLAALVPEKKIYLLMYGTEVMPGTRDALISASKFLAPNVVTLLLDGHNDSLGEISRAAADVFISFADSFQETFGLTPNSTEFDLI